MSGLSEPGQRNAGCQCAEIHLQGSGDKRCLGGIQRDPVEAQQLAGLLLQRVGIGGSQGVQCSQGGLRQVRAGAQRGDEMRQHLTPDGIARPGFRTQRRQLVQGAVVPVAVWQVRKGDIEPGSRIGLGGGELAQEMQVAGQRVAVGQCRQATGTAGVGGLDRQVDGGDAQGGLSELFLRDDFQAHGGSCKKTAGARRHRP